MHIWIYICSRCKSRWHYLDKTNISRIFKGLDKISRISIPFNSMIVCVWGGGGGGGSTHVNSLNLTLCMLGDFPWFRCLLIFFLNQLFQKSLSWTLSECKTVSLQIPIRVQTVCNGYQQMTKVPASRRQKFPLGRVRVKTFLYNTN